MKYPVYLFILIAVIISACNDNEQIPQSATVEFSVPLPVFVNDIPLLDSGATMTIRSTSVDINASDSFEKYNVIAQNIGLTDLTQIDIFTQRFCEVDLSFLRTVKIYIESEGLAPKLIGQRDSISKVAGGIGWTVRLNENLTPYLNQGSFWINLEFESDEKTEELGFLKVTPRFTVTATTGLN